MNWTNEQYDDVIKRLQTGDPGSKGPGPHTGLQKPKGKRKDRTACKEANEPHHRQFHITVTIRNSDQRSRDLDNALSTLLDCIVKAVGRVCRSHPNIKYIAPIDDSWKWIPSISIANQIVPKGEEGATIAITPLT
jgi:hypothetical protein